MGPKYRQIIEWIKERLESGELSVGDKIESENQISAMFGMSRQTVRHALSDLIQEGILESRRGSGTYVRDTDEYSGRTCQLSQTVTIVSTYVNGYIFLKILQTMTQTLEEHGYNVKIVFTNDRIKTERHILEKILAEEEKGPLIVEPVMSGLPNPNLVYYRKLKEMGIPILFFHTYYPHLSIPHVSMNDVEAGKKATEYLISKGHKKIGAIFRLDDGQGKRRYLGYIEALLEAGLDIDESKVSWLDRWEQEKITENTEHFWQKLNGCTACVCYNDLVAAAMIESAKEYGISVPDDVSIIGIDNADVARLCSVPLTSVDHPKGNLGKKVAEQMLQMIDNPNFNSSYEFSVEVIERESVRDMNEIK